MSSFPVIKFLFKKEWKILSDALGSHPAYETEDYSSANDLTTYLSSIEACLIVTCVNTKQDLIQLATLVKMMKKIAPEAIAKIVVVNFSNDKNFEGVIAKLGILDIIESKVSTRALRFKVDFWMKSIAVQVKKNATRLEKNQSKAADAAKTKEKKEVTGSLRWLPALELEDDIWIIRHESECRKVLSRWLIKLIGPGPYVAQWVENRPGLWKFEFSTETKELFTAGRGCWYFKGDQRPEFIWKENIWLITGDSFELYYGDGVEKFERIRLESRVLAITKNSDFALTKEYAISETFDKDLVLKKENASTQVESVDSDTERLNSLKGRGKTDHLQSKPLSGTASTDHVNERSLSMDLNFDSPKKGRNQSLLMDKEVSSGSDFIDRSKRKDGDHPFFSDDAEERPLNELQINQNPSDFSFGQETSSRDEVDMKSYFGKQDKAQNSGLTGHVVPLYNLKTKPFFADDFDNETEQSSQSAKVISILYQNGNRWSCHLDDFFDNKIIFKGSRVSLQLGKDVELDLLFSYLDQDTKLKLIGYVDSVDVDDEGMHYVSVGISEKNVSAFEAFVKLYRLRQENIDIFLKRAKGL